jgi:uncharacterized protein YggE
MENAMRSMHMSRVTRVMRSALLGAGFSLGFSALAPMAAAAQGMHTLPPHVVVSASEEIGVAPDRAHLTVSVETRGRTSQLASQENARLAAAVLESLQRVGIAAAQIRTIGLTVNPEYRYPEGGGRPTVVGYQARNSMEVEIRNITRVGSVVDATLAAGATNLSGPSFTLANPDSARREALATAVRRAQADAEVMARAAGQKLGVVLEMSSGGGMEQPMFDRGPMLMSARAEGAPETPVATGMIKVRANVTMRIQLIGTP